LHVMLVRIVMRVAPENLVIVGHSNAPIS
jgi:hypothetical protein